MKNKSFLYLILMTLPLALFLALSTGCGSSKSGSGHSPGVPGPGDGDGISPTDPIQLDRAPKYYGQMTVTDKGAYRELLKDHRLCDLYSHWNFGDASCKAYDRRAEIGIAFEKKSLASNGTVGIHVFHDQWGYRTTLHFTGAFQLINDSQGFQMQTPGYLAGYSKMLRFRVAEGQFGDDYLRMDLTYAGKAIGHVDLHRIE